MASSSGAPQIICAVLVACITGCILFYFRVKKKREIIKKDILTKGVAAKLMSSNSSQINYDVFVSFRGEDIRRGFLSHLTKAFTQKQIQFFVDDKLERGDDISSSLFEAIEGSSISLIIFSENYASSHWCLEELVKILECKEKHGQSVIPVFYEVDPSDVRHQKNGYGNALTELEKKFILPRVQIWRQALNKSANLSGFKSLDFQNDADLLEEVINHVLRRLMPKHPVITKGLIGMEKPTAHLESLLCQESKEARVIGIWGMGGIGKTTLAEEIFNKKSFEYERSCFLDKVKDELQKHGMRSLKEKLVSTLLAEDVKINTPYRLPNDIKRRIGRMKVLIVLDDVNDIDLVENIFGTLDWLQAGSRIIITTRDKQVLISNQAHHIYQVGQLSFSEALKLFHLNAFDQSHLEKGYYDLSQRVVNYSKGVPLVLVVLGRLLRGKSKEVWESQLDKLTKGPVKEVHDLMRLSYENLDRKEQQILLDVACFFNGMKMKIRALLPLLKDHENDNSGAVGLERLKDRALVTISKDNIVSMHDIIQEMGREIVRQESEDPGQWSRLWDHNVYEVFKYNRGTEAIRSIRANFSEIWNLDLSPDVFVKMNKLQFLSIYEEGGTECQDLFSQCRGLLLSLKYLIWTRCPSWPECFSPESLVKLVLHEGKMQRLWHGVQKVNLKEVVLYRCSFLEELPDFSKAINLRCLILRHCVKLKSVHPSIYSLNKLQVFNLEGCESLTEFTSDTGLSSLLYLNLTSCTSLRKLSMTSENIRGLHLSCIPANVLPTSFACQSKLEKLVLQKTEYEQLPACITNLTRLLHLDLTSCAKLQSIPVLPPSLKVLYASGCRSLKTIFFPSTAAEQFKENRQSVFFNDCWNLDERSLRGIELNAQINLMKLTYQHPFAPVYDDQVDKYENGFDRAMYGYPGCIVPKWIEYKTTKGDMIIDLGRAPLLGFIFCFILTGDGDEDSTEYVGRVKIEITIIDGEGKKGYVMDSTTTKDNVFLIYDKKCSDNIISATKNQTRFKIKVAILEVRSKGGRVMNWKIREFGVSPIYTLTYDSFRHLARNCECDAAEESPVEYVYEQARESP